MQANNIDKRELKDYRLGTRKPSSVNITDENAVYKFLEEHPEYNETCKKVETKTSLIKKGLKEVLVNENIPGAQIVEGKSISIKQVIIVNDDTIYITLTLSVENIDVVLNALEEKALNIKALRQKIYNVADNQINIIKQQKEAQQTVEEEPLKDKKRGRKK